MSPTKQLSDPNNGESLEGGSTTVESPNLAKAPEEQTVTASMPTASDSSLDSLEGSNLRPEAPAPKPPFLKRMWQKLNIYLLLFILVILIALGIVVFFTIKDKKQTTSSDNVATQGLSEESLKQLANSDTTIGSPKQVLTIESNAIFAGTVLVRNDLEVAGTIRVNGALALPGITVSGSSSFNQIQATTLGITGAATVNGTLTARSGLSVNGNSNFSGGVSATQITTGSLQLNGDLVLTRHITAGGPIPSIAQGSAVGNGGTASVSGSDTTGTVTVNTGSSPGAGCFATITFTRAFSGTPHVALTPVGASAASIDYYVNRSTSNFSVCTVSPSGAGQTFGFDYIILN